MNNSSVHGFVFFFFKKFSLPQRSQFIQNAIKNVPIPYFFWGGGGYGNGGYCRYSIVNDGVIFRVA